MKLAVCELPDGLALTDPSWTKLLETLHCEKPDLLILNEMPMGNWIAEKPGFDSEEALKFVSAHDELVAELGRLPWGTFGSRPVSGGACLANEAFLVSAGAYKPVHHKHYFPNEVGWYEKNWFAPTKSGFDLVEYGEVSIGALLCTELMFNEWARHYRRIGANVIAVPRAGASLNTKWRAAGAMAAIVSGCYVVSSNRAEHATMPKGLFGGEGFVYSPYGELIAKTSASSPVAIVEIDPDLVKKAKFEYPCYVSEFQEALPQFAAHSNLQLS